MKVGDPFPEFSLPDQSGRIWTKSDVVGKTTVFFFYPKDNTPGCTLEAKGFRDLYPSFEKLSALVLGVSGGSLKSHVKFHTSCRLPYPLLLDEKGDLARSVGVWGKKRFLGRTFEGIQRTTFLVRKDGSVGYVFERVRPEGHAEEVLEVLEKGI